MNSIFWNNAPSNDVRSTGVSPLKDFRMDAWGGLGDDEHLHMGRAGGVHTDVQPHVAQVLTHSCKCF